MAEIGKLVATFEADTRKFDAGVRGVQTKIGSLAKDIDKTTGTTAKFSGSLDSATTGLGGMTSALSIAAGASVLAASAITGAAAGILKLTQFATQLGSEIHDLSQKINFSAETLSALKVAAELSGGSLNSMGTAFGIFDRNMEEAKDTASEMSGVFKTLKIDTDDNEKALRRAFTVLASLEGGAQQTAIAMKLFGRSGKEVLGIVKESNGNIDQYIEQMKELGFVITKEGAEKADKFGDSLTLVKTQLEFVGRQIGEELLPIVARASADFSKWLKDNQVEMRKVASEVASVVDWVMELKRALELLPAVTVVRVIRQLIHQDITSPTSPESQAQERSARPTPGELIPQPNWADPGEFVSPGSTVPQAPGQITFPKRAGGGGRGRGRAARKEQDEFTELLRRQQRELAGLAATTNVAEAALELLDDRYKKLTPNQRDQVLTIARHRDIEEQRLSIQREIRTFMDEQNKSIRELSENLNSNLGRTQAQIKEWERMGAVIPETISWWAKFNATILDSSDALERMTGWLERAGDLLPGQGFAVPDFDPNAIGRALEGQLGPPPIDRSEEIARFRAQMEQVASEITGLFDRALYDGISGGAKRGLQSLALGFLDIIQQVVLGKLKTALAEALSGLGGGTGGGGGFFSGLLKAIIGGAVGGAVGGGSTGRIGQSRAGGGPMWPGEIYRVHKDETIVPMSPQFVIPKNGMGQQTVNNFNISVPVQRGSSASSPRSRRQIAEDIQSAIGAYI